MYVITKLIVLLTTLQGVVGPRAATWDYCECEFVSWAPWSHCTELCYGTQDRYRQVRLRQHPGCDEFTDCASNDMGSEQSECNKFCHNGGTFASLSTGCSCVPGKEGRCCDETVTCAQPPKPTNGEVSYSSLDYGSTATYSCHRDYNITSGSPSRTCQANGRWSGETAQCQYVNTCSSNPCKNGGSCINGVESYTCQCQSGWSGINCEKVNGGWTNYTLDTTGKCSVSCGGGTKTLSYSRTCTNPRPQYGGNDCEGANTKDTQEDCNTQPCPINGGWTEFTEWKEINECNSLCGGGIKEEQRDRTCTNPTPANGGDDCDGELSQVRNVTCNTEHCGDKCPSGQVKYIAHDGNKNRFYQCDNGVARLRDCATGTMWSQGDTTCIHAPVAAAPTHAPVSTECDASDGLVTDPDNCHNYRMCDGGQYKTVPCAPGTAFNPAIKTCDHVTNVPDCN